MKRSLIAMVIVLTALAMLGGCATQAERAAQRVETVRKVAAALSERSYKIDIDRMYPLRGSMRAVSYGYSVEVRNDSLISYLPYFGRAYDIPYGGGKGLDFSAPIGSYREWQLKNGTRRIEIGVGNEEDSYLYTLEVLDNGGSTLNVQAQRRERISYSGEMIFDK